MIRVLLVMRVNLYNGDAMQCSGLGAKSEMSSRCQKRGQSVRRARLHSFRGVFELSQFFGNSVVILMEREYIVSKVSSSIPGQVRLARYSSEDILS